MKDLKNLCKSIYRSVLPKALRQTPMIWKLKSLLLGHDRIYTAEYYRGQEQTSAKSASEISNSIMHDLRPNSLVDVGCGTGALLQALQDQGCEAFGLELSEAALDTCKRGRLNVAKFDLESDDPPSEWRFDVVASLEVGEHLPEKSADRFVALISSLAPNIVFSAAPPGQLGVDHVNLQPPAYWIQKFRDQGFDFLEDLSVLWRERWKQSEAVKPYYHRNLLLFSQSSGESKSNNDR